LLFSFFGAAVVFCTLYCFLQHMRRLVNVFVVCCIGRWYFASYLLTLWCGCPVPPVLVRV
jgi:hypothetical protein